MKKMKIEGQTEQSQIKAIALPVVQLKKNFELVEILEYDSNIVVNGSLEALTEYTNIIQKLVNGLEIGYDFGENPPTLKIHGKEKTLTVRNGQYIVKPINALKISEKECIENMEEVINVTTSNYLIPNIIY